MPNPVIDHVDYNNTTYDIKDTTSGYITGGANSPSTVTITPTTTNIYEITNVGSTPTLTFAQDTTDSKQLNITWSAGSTPSRSQVSGVWTGVSSATAGAQTFTGTNNIQSAGSNIF